MIPTQAMLRGVSRRTSLRILLTIAASAAVLQIGCGSGRASVSGYPDSELNGKRIFVLIPGEADLRILDSNALAFSRGVSAVAVRNFFFNEMRSTFPAELNGRYDSNTVLEYSTQPVGAMVPLEASNVFNGATPRSWDVVDNAARNGNIDYLLVIHRLTVTNVAASGGEGRGEEEVVAEFGLLDPAKNRVMAYGQVEAAVDDPRAPRATWTALAEEISQELPFHIRQN